MYLGDPPERHDVPTGGLIHVEPGTPLQTVNHGEQELLVYAYGTPPESERAEILDSRAVVSSRLRRRRDAVRARRTRPSDHRHRIGRTQVEPVVEQRSDRPAHPGPMM
jgi:hypothetical protein